MLAGTAPAIPIDCALIVALEKLAVSFTRMPQLGALTLAPLKLEIRPVSYTHLDVYKRQFHRLPQTTRANDARVAAPLVDPPRRMPAERLTWKLARPAYPVADLPAYPVADRTADAQRPCRADG